MRAKVLRVEDQLYDYELYLYLGFSFDKYVKHLSDKFGIVREGIEGYGETVYVGSQIFIWLNPELDKTNTLGTLVHEAVHAARIVLTNRGMSLDVDNAEGLAYYTDFIFRQFVKKGKLL